MPAQDLQTIAQLDSVGKQKIAVLDFWADWAGPCAQLNVVFDKLAESYPSLEFFKVEAEKLEDVTEKFEVTVVPTFLLYQNGKILDRIVGANGPELASKVEKYSKSQASSNTTNDSTTDKERINDRLTKLINFAPVMLFMKGTPSEPRCGFSKKIVDVLNSQGVQFESFNILSDNEIREGLKAYSNWPTYPQLYSKGKLIGGLDIVKELAEEGQLLESL